jgi:hypothetical protein
MSVALCFRILPSRNHSAQFSVSLGSSVGRGELPPGTVFADGHAPSLICHTAAASETLPILARALVQAVEDQGR